MWRVSQAWPWIGEDQADGVLDDPDLWSVQTAQDSGLTTANLNGETKPWNSKGYPQVLVSPVAPGLTVSTYSVADFQDMGSPVSVGGNPYQPTHAGDLDVQNNPPLMTPGRIDLERANDQWKGGVPAAFAGRGGCRERSQTKHGKLHATHSLPVGQDSCCCC